MSMQIAPHISEKAVAMAEKGVYVFDVPSDANKISVTQAIEKAFKVEVTDVNILVTKGKLKRFQKTTGRRKDVKKAYVKLKKGQSIALFEGAN
jgi:large subunit ribosomal protein L23